MGSPQSRFSSLKNRLWACPLTGRHEHVAHPQARRSEFPENIPGIVHFASPFFQSPSRCEQLLRMEAVNSTRTMLLGQERLHRILKWIAKQIECDDERPTKLTVIDLCTTKTLKHCKALMI